MTILQADFSGAIRKTQTLYGIPKAARKLLSIWAAETTKQLKRSAADLQKSGKGRKTGQLARSISFAVDLSGEEYKTSVGTNLMGSGVSSKYARIQDEGGVTHPTVTPKMRRWAWFMYRKEQGVQRRELRKILPGLSRSQLRGTARMGASKYLGIALTKKAKLDVRIPATHWFSRVIDARRPVLSEMMLDTAILKKAEEMAGTGGSGG
jgi:hypothetical protein